MAKEENPATTRFREYLRIRTVPPEPQYNEAAIFLQKQAQEMGLPCKVLEVHPNRPVIIITWEGTQPDLPTIMLNSHTDVVPVDKDHWLHDPFEAVKTSDGKIYARGTQDMKSVGMQYLEAIRILMKNGQKLLRTIHVTFVPDEEIGGILGMCKFLKTDTFKEMNVGFALDEGYANPTNQFFVFNGDRNIWWVKVTCIGNPGHGSQFIPNTAAEKMRKVINSFMDFREQEKNRLETNELLTLGDVTTINMNIIEGGVQTNVVPSEISATFDIRIPPTVNLEEFESKIKDWCQSAGEGVTFEFLQKSPPARLTSTKPENRWWKTFSDVCQDMKMELKCEIFPAATDSRYLRVLGYPALGFSPINNTPILLHDHNEYLEENVFLKGIEIYTKIIPAMANMAPS